MSHSVDFTLPGPGANLSPPNNSAPAAENLAPRPPNQWILFLKEFNRQYTQGPDRDNSLSACERAQIASKIWATYSTDQKVYWKKLAKDAAKRHSEMFPGYIYQPRAREGKELKKKSRRRKPREKKAAEVIQAIPQSQERTFPVTRSPRNHGARYNPYPVPTMSAEQPFLFSSPQHPYGSPGVFDTTPRPDTYQPPRPFYLPVVPNAYLAPPFYAQYMVQPQYQTPIASSSGTSGLPTAQGNGSSIVPNVEALDRFLPGVSTNDTVPQVPLEEPSSNPGMWDYINFDG